MLRRLDNVDPGVKEFFAPAAQLVLESDDPHNAMCAALAALSGLMEVPKPRRWAGPSVGPLQQFDQSHKGNSGPITCSSLTSLTRVTVDP